MTMFDFPRRTPLVMQAEGADCGLACVLIVAGAHSLHMDLPAARERHATSLRGATLADLMAFGRRLNLLPRALRLDLAQLPQLQLPCILHWDFNHFVVLTKVRRGRVTIHDPAFGVREIALPEVSRHFTGVALELTPSPDFRAERVRAAVPLSRLLGGLPGLGGGAARILVLALMLQMLAVIAPMQIQWVVDRAVVAHDRDLVTVLGLGFLLVIGFQAVISTLRGWLLNRLGALLKLHLMTRLFRHLIRLPMAWFEKRQVGDVISRFESLEQIQNSLTTSAVESVVDGLMTVVTLAMMFIYSPKLAGIVLAAATLYTFARLLLYVPLRRASELQIVKRAAQHSHFLETVRGMQCVKLFAAEDERSRGWHNRVVEQFNATLRAQWLTLLGQSINGLLFGVESVVVIWVGALLVLDAGGFTVGMLFAFITFKTQFAQRFVGLVDKGLEMRLLGLHAERVGDVLASPLEPRDEREFEPTADDSEACLELKGVRFAYGDGDVPVLDGIDLRIEAGESIAIVGPSGAGKTTLVKIMLGLIKPQDGSVEFGGRTPERIGLTRYRKQVASVMQDDTLFAGSIADNIAFFDRDLDEARVAACARMAAVHDDIVAMPMQYDTLVGEMGSALSGGQKQRILLARALYRRPKLLVLDEATSHLDLVRERSVNEAIKALKITRIIVAHRKETIASADRVVVLERGRIKSPLSVAERPAVEAA